MVHALKTRFICIVFVIATIMLFRLQLTNNLPAAAVNQAQVWSSYRARLEGFSGAEPRFWCLKKPVVFPRLRATIPVFILVKDRLAVFDRAFASYEHLTTPHRLYVVDGNSTYPPMLQRLSQLEAAGTTVFRFNREWTEQASKLDAGDRITFLLTIPIQAALAEVLKNEPSTEYYVVADPDVDISTVPPEMLDLFAGILECCPALTKVGPQLLWQDIPLEYPHVNQVTAMYETIWKRKGPALVKFNGRDFYMSLPNGIDTHFSMRKADKDYCRLGLCKNNGSYAASLTMAPYVARHLDFYPSQSAYAGEEEEWYRAHSAQGISHYAGKNSPGYTGL
jgi:hypothetical protein